MKIDVPECDECKVVVNEFFLNSKVTLFTSIKVFFLFIVGFIFIGFRYICYFFSSIFRTH